MKMMKQNAGVDRGLNAAAQAVREGAVVPCDTIDDILRVAGGLTGTLAPFLTMI